MSNPPSGQEDQPAVRARIPAEVAGGQISTGVIIVTGPMEFLLDFVRSLPRPNAIVSRVVLPHGVMPQFIQALEKNLELFRQRFGPIPGEEHSKSGLMSGQMPSAVSPSVGHSEQHQGHPQHSEPSSPAPQSPSAQSPSPDAAFGNPIDVHAGSSLNHPQSPHDARSDQHLHSHDPAAHEHDASGRSDDHRPNRLATPQDIYDELKLRDELLSGTYANAVMIGHGQFEFSFDFITNFYPQSAVSARVFMAAGHVPRLLESLKAAWEQLRPRLQGGGF